MMNPQLLFICLLIGTGCLVVITVAIALLARDVRVAARRLSALMPHGEALLQRSHQVVTRVDAMLLQAEEAVRQVRVVTVKACEAAADTLHAVATAKQTATTWVEQHFSHGLGNGAGSRRSRGRSRGTR